MPSRAGATGKKMYFIQLSQSFYIELSGPSLEYLGPKNIYYCDNLFVKRSIILSINLGILEYK